MHVYNLTSQHFFLVFFVTVCLGWKYLRIDSNIMILKFKKTTDEV